MKKYSFMLVLCSLAMLLLSGCGSKEYGYVSGTVKINGEPVEGAFVTFTPKEGGRQATAKTDAKGFYELDYTPGVKGAKLGTNTVKLTTFESPSRDDNRNIIDPGTPERFPPKYNVQQSETVDVKPGNNTFDFDVEATQESYESAEEN